MNRIPITVCLLTSTKGHFGFTDLYRQTVSSLLSQVPSDSWTSLLAHIKVSEPDRLEPVSSWLMAQGFSLLVTGGSWSHGDQSHQTGYLADLATIVHKVSSPYLLMVEDDWLIRCYVQALDHWMHKATSLLEADPELMQVRIARFSDEDHRISLLPIKHGLDGRVAWAEDGASFRHSDWSNNPYLARTRDLRAALRLVSISNLPKHSEHGVGAAMRLLSRADLPFACLNPERIRCGHIGVADPSQADDLDQPLFAE